MSYRKYDEQFKKQIVKLHIEGRTVPELGVEYGISPTSIYKWVKIYSNIETPPTPQNLKDVYRENKRLKQEIDILKQAMTIMTAK